MPARLIVTIDGPAGVGKSSLAAMLADKLKIPCLDTGAMFRFLALKLGDGGTDLSDAEIVEQCATLRFSLHGASLYCNGKRIGQEIRTEAISALASKLAQKKVIRDILLDVQRALGAKTSLVAEGRDMGTVVFPSASCKFFLDATPHARALRRWRQNGKKEDLAELERMIERRDQQDRSRPIAPLKPAHDACIIDTTELNIEQVLEKMLDYIRQKHKIS